MTQKNIFLFIMKEEIPKQIHQIWIGEKEPPYLYMDSWSKNYIKKNPEWKYRFWNEESINDFWNKNNDTSEISVLRSLYCIEENLAGKSDILRLAILYVYGGIYIDSDSVWINNKSLNPLIEQSSTTGIFCSLENDTESRVITNGVVGCSKHHCCIKELIDIVVGYQDTFLQRRYHFEPWQLTGPKLFDKLKRDKVTLFPSVYFYPISWYNITNNLLHTKIELPSESYMFQYGISTNNLNYSTNKTDSKGIVFTCTAFFKSEEKVKIFDNTLDTFLRENKEHLYLINKFIVIVEYSPNNNNYMAYFKNKFPMITFIDKSIEEKGQAKSLNMIIVMIKSYKYWIHWEDSWFSIGPTLKEGFDILESTDIQHYSFTKREILYDMPIISNTYIECKKVNDVKIIKPRHDIKDLFRKWQMNESDWSVWKDNGCWPFFSLRPSINKVSSVLNAGYFSEDEEKWPFQFEFEWAIRWVLRNNIVVGIYKNIKVVRENEKHISTYTTDNYNKWLVKLQTREKKEEYNRFVPYFTLKNDKSKVIFFWYPCDESNELKKLVHELEEGYPYNGKNISRDIGEYNKNKYFVEINTLTMTRFKEYSRILVIHKSNLSKIHIHPSWIQEIVDPSEINVLRKRFL